MKIINIATDTTGTIGYVPRIVRIETDAALVDIMTLDFVNKLKNMGYPLAPTDEVHIRYKDNAFGIFGLTAAGVLAQISQPFRPVIFGVATLVGGMIVVPEPAIQANSVVIATWQTVVPIGHLSVSPLNYVPGVSFRIDSNNAGDTGPAAYYVLV